MNNLNNWYTGCASVQLKDEPFAAEIADQKIVLFRDSDGKPVALMDRCCHRGFPLSRSKIKDGRIVCGFHGWEYDRSGQCVRIPSQPEDRPVPKSFCVPSFPCAESDGFVWVWLGDQAPGPVPSMPEVHSGNWIQGARIVQCNYLRALEITYDGAHVYFAHPTHPATIAAMKNGFGPSESEIRVTRTGCISFSPAVSSEEDSIPESTSSMEFILPNRIRFVWKNGAQTFFMYFNVVPITEKSCRVEWLISNPMPNAPKFLWVGDQGREIIEEDQVILELIQHAYEQEGESFEKSVEADATALTLRRIVKAAQTGEWNPEKWPYPKRRVITTMGPASYG